MNSDVYAGSSPAASGNVGMAESTLLLLYYPLSSLKVNDDCKDVIAVSYFGKFPIKERGSNPQHSLCLLLLASLNDAVDRCYFGLDSKSNSWQQRRLLFVAHSIFVRNQNVKGVVGQ